MYRTAIASAALIAAVSAQSCGNAVVVNKCSYDVYMANTPSFGGGYNEVDKTLSSGASYTQEYTQLSNGNGWSLKLSKTAGAFQDNILQYEYTYHGDGIIWYDLSEVNGNPWDGNWEITATNGCSPRQAAYRYATDDAYGMQSCASGASITVTLCSGDAGGSGGASSPAESSPATTAWTSPAATTPAATTTAWGGHTWGVGSDGALEAPAAKAVVQPDNKAHKHGKAQDSEAPTPVSDSWDGPAVTVTNVQMETMTKYVTATAAPAKRHAHHPRHPHRR